MIRMRGFLSLTLPACAHTFDNMCAAAQRKEKEIKDSEWTASSPAARNGAQRLFSFHFLGHPSQLIITLWDGWKMRWKDTSCMHANYWPLHRKETKIGTYGPILGVHQARSAHSFVDWTTNASRELWFWSVQSHKLWDKELPFFFFMFWPTKDIRDKEFKARTNKKRRKRSSLCWLVHDRRSPR